MLKRFLLLFVACAFFQGCIHFGKTVPIGVFDGDTGQPVAGATVNVAYIGGFWELFPPHDVEAMTGADGLAKVKVTGGGGAIISVTAPGYVSYSAYPRDHVPPTFELREINGKKVHAVPIYRLSPPQIVIVLPDGYRGAVRVTRKYSNRWVQDEPGKRIFKFVASPEGDVEIEASPLLHRINEWGSRLKFDEASGVFQFRYANSRQKERLSQIVYDVFRRWDSSNPFWHISSSLDTSNTGWH